MSISEINAIKVDENKYNIEVTKAQLEFIQKSMGSYLKELERAKQKYYKKRVLSGAPKPISMMEKFVITA